MKRAGILLLFGIMAATPATAVGDWRWADPILKKQTIKYSCKTLKCIRNTYIREKKRYKHRVERYHDRRLKEWKRWTRTYIPLCTWYGESGHGPEYARHRYVMMNSGGSGARGKFQFMPGTYYGVAKYKDWSPLDQEIAARRLFRKAGTGPWSACH